MVAEVAFPWQVPVDRMDFGATSLTYRYSVAMWQQPVAAERIVVDMAEAVPSSCWQEEGNLPNLDVGLHLVEEEIAQRLPLQIRQEEEGE